MSGIVGLLIASLLVLGCGSGDSSAPPSAMIELRTQEPVDSQTPVACMAALIEGVLVADAATGVALADPAGFVRPIIWPHGYAARRGIPIAVVDADGMVIAQVGDRVAIGGGEIDSDGAWMACGGIKVIDVP